MRFSPRQWVRKLLPVLEIPDPDPVRRLGRIEIMERDIVLPIKAAVIAMLIYSFLVSPWFGIVSNTLDVAVEAVQYFFWMYVVVNVAVAILLLFMERLPFALTQWAVFTISLVDGLFLSALVLVSGGYDSFLYWLFVGLIVRNAISTPPAMSQLVLNLAVSLCYVLAGVLDVFVSQNVGEPFDAEARLAADLGFTGNPAEPFLLRLFVLWLTTLSCYAVQVLLEKQRQTLDEAREFSMREGQLRAAGRLAAELAHQIKNPLAIINNAAFSIQRALKEGKADPVKQIQIIQEEVERSDRILTQLMGYAQLSQGRVERLSVTEELDRAIEQVFPPAAHYAVKIHRDYASHFPPLLMQRQHLSEVLVNLLQNAREATSAQGNVRVSAVCHGDYSIEVTIGDDGPGISSDEREQVFEAYYTSKKKGTGLGLAIVKNNVELYGGSVRAESELGKGARFIVVFPAKSLMKLAK